MRYARRYWLAIIVVLLWGLVMTTGTTTWAASAPASPNQTITLKLFMPYVPHSVTLQGKTATFDVDGDDIKVNGANLVVKDTTASNGVIHAIDAVSLPSPD
jgi:uncharacterized surface protein with fasciclin (FAS1) repeats